ncbi:MAG: asparagine synthase (glutamine-hydrolyzing) [Desulfobacteraceae bacterium]|nr:MAG: asparagine synthase (glutamine-hydrolyzing) [Desulfobacteraceae bacterium]
MKDGKPPVPQAYLQWGIRCLERFMGMFALGILDERDMTLYLARDRMGKKPLYYHAGKGMLMFASELKAMMQFSCFGRKVDKEALALYLHYQYVPAPHTIFEDTFKLLPGHYMKYDGRQLSLHPFWSLPCGEYVPMEEDEALDKLDGLLTSSVSDRLVSDVPLGALLSGGIDSSLVSAILQKVSERPAKTFTIGFKETGYDEAPWASRVAKRLGTEHTELYVTPGEAMEVIPRLPEIYDEPFADTSAIPTFLVSRLARTKVTVALSGDGGDEQFCGYVRYWSTLSMARAVGRTPPGIRKAAGSLLNLFSPAWVEKIYVPWRDLLPQRFRMANFRDKWQKLIALLAEDTLQELYRATVCVWSKEEVKNLFGLTVKYGTFERGFEADPAVSILSRLMRTDLLTYLPDAMLTKVDRASMAVGLEVRVPLLDQRVVEFAAGIPETLKYRGGSGKYLLKKLLARYLPEELFERPKMGFGVPVELWLRGELREMMLDYLAPQRLASEGLFSPNLVSRYVNEHLNGTISHHHRLWALLMWEMWRERWLEGK